MTHPAEITTSSSLSHILAKMMAANLYVLLPDRRSLILLLGVIYMFLIFPIKNGEKN